MAVTSLETCRRFPEVRMDGLLLPALIALLVLALTALAAGAESRDGFAVTDDRPVARH